MTSGISSHYLWKYTMARLIETGLGVSPEERELDFVLKIKHFFLC